MSEKICNNNIVDERLHYLQSIGKMPKDDGLFQKMDHKYWKKFIDQCDDDIVDYVLSFPQPGNWNGWLYAQCEIRRGLKPNR